MSGDARTRAKPGARLVWGAGALAAVAFVALLAFGLLTRAPDTTIDDALARSEATPAPGFNLRVFERGQQQPVLRNVVDRAAADGRVSLKELRGTPVVLNFWASWCDPCRVEAPVLERGSRRAGREGVLFVGLNMQDVTGDAHNFINELSVTYLNVREGGDDTFRRYGATGLPETYFVSARGEVVAHVIGAIDDARLRAGIDAARSGRPAAAREGGERQPAR